MTASAPTAPAGRGADEDRRVSDETAHQLHPDDERALEVSTSGTTDVLPQGGLPPGWHPRAERVGRCA